MKKKQVLKDQTKWRKRGFWDMWRKCRGNVEAILWETDAESTWEETGKVIEALVEAGIRDRDRVIVGGAPVNERFTDENIT
jgi:hypothetical protein